VISDTNWPDDQIESWLRPVVAAGAQVNALRHTTIGADMDVSQIVDPHVFADPAVRADLQSPWKFDTHSGFYFDAGSDLRAE
jgi:hypothetical protein